MDREDVFCYYCMAEQSGNGAVCAKCGHERRFQQSNIRALPIRQILNGRYLIGRTLGVGGYGVTYLALDLAQDQKVVVKEYLPEAFCKRAANRVSVCPVDAQEYQYAMKHFQIETETLEHLQDIAQVPRYTASFAENGTLYYVMEYLDGYNLGEYFRTHPKLKYDAALELLLPVVSALELVHRHEVLHRDISPDNIFLCRNGGVKLIDFGSAQYSASRITASFTPTVKMSYAPPEQFLGNRNGVSQGRWSDEYSLGAVFYRALTGQAPVPGNERVIFQDERELAAPSQKGAFCTKKQDEVILKALALDRDQRHGDIATFGYALIQAVANPRKQKALLEEYPILDASARLEPQRELEAAIRRHLSLEGRKTIAYLLDALLFFGVPVLLLGGAHAALGLLEGYLLGVLVCLLMEMLPPKASPGEWCMGLWVSAAGGEPPALDALLLRGAIRLPPPVALLSGLWLLKGKAATIAETISRTRASEKIHPTMPRPPQNRYMLQMVKGRYEGAMLPLKQGRMVIGRDPETCDLTFPGDCAGISRRHCCLELHGEKLTLTDMNSTYGTFLSQGDRRIVSDMPYALALNESFRVGKEEMQIVSMR